jgi:hypothetical protein
MEKYFQLPIIVSVIIAVIILLVIAKVTGFGMDSKPKGLTQAQYDALSAENKALYTFDASSGTYVKK